MRNMALQFIDEDTIAAIERMERPSAKVAGRGVMGLWKRVIKKLLENLDADGPRSIVQFERAMKGTRSLAK